MHHEKFYAVMCSIHLYLKLNLSVEQIVVIECKNLAKEAKKTKKSESGAMDHSLLNSRYMGDTLYIDVFSVAHLCGLPVAPRKKTTRVVPKLKTISPELCAENRHPHLLR